MLRRHSSPPLVKCGSCNLLGNTPDARRPGTRMGGTPTLTAIHSLPPEAEISGRQTNRQSCHTLSKLRRWNSSQVTVHGDAQMTAADVFRPHAHEAGKGTSSPSSSSAARSVRALQRRAPRPLPWRRQRNASSHKTLVALPSSFLHAFFSRPPLAPSRLGWLSRATQDPASRSASAVPAGGAIRNDFIVLPTAPRPGLSGAQERQLARRISLNKQK